MDDFKDLKWVDAPSSTTSGGSATRPSRTSSSSADAFSLLASSVSKPNYLSSVSNPPSRSLTPSLPPKPVQASSGDAFSSLFSTGGSRPTLSKAPMSMAQRQAKAERERTQKEEQERQTLHAHPAFWDQLDSSRPRSVQPQRQAESSGLPPVLRPTSASGSGSTQSQSRPSLGQFSALTPTVRPISPNPPAKPTTASRPPTTVWDFDLLSGPTTSATVPQVTVKPASTDLLDDFDVLSASPARAPPPSSSKPPATTLRTDDEFDDFQWEPAHRDAPSPADSDDDDVLGLLGKPVSRQSSPPPQTVSILAVVTADCLIKLFEL